VRTEIFTKFFPRCGIPDAWSSWDAYEEYVRWLYATGSIDEHTQIWWSVRPHLAFPTVEIRICDGQPHLAEAIPLVALMYSLTARIARALDEGEPLPDHPHHLLEENFWRAIRYGLSGELLDLGRFPEPVVRPARAAIEELVEWVLPVAEELGAAHYLSIPAANPAERQIARYEAGGTLREIYAAEVLEPARV
jgi:carboxylate-amine ligase